jgi:hypothetical protein
MFRAPRATIAFGAGLVTALGLLPARAQSPAPSPVFDVHLARARASDRQRVASALQHAAERYSQWLGPPPAATFVVTDELRGAGGSRQAAEIGVDLPWWPAPAGMDVESQAAFELARWWLAGPHRGRGSAPLVDGAAWYLQSRIVEDLFDYAFLRTAHSADGLRLFGDAIPWPVPSLRLSRWSAGLGRGEWLSWLRGGTWDAARRWGVRRLPPATGPDVVRAALAFGTLERYLEWPALQGALSVWARRAAERELTREEIEQTIAAAAGQDLAWFFPAALDSARRFDYAVTAHSSERAGPRQCDSDACFLTAVTVERLGNAVFSGSSREPEGAFESGDALEVRVGFADGQQASARWDGRQASKTFVFESESPAVAAEVDPDCILLLDENRLNNVRRLTSVSNVPTRRWVVRWMVWLEDAMLSSLAVLGS